MLPALCVRGGSERETGGLNRARRPRIPAGTRDAAYFAAAVLETRKTLRGDAFRRPRAPF